MKNKKRIQIKTQLEFNYGIGKIQSKLICNQLGISSNLRNNQLTKYEKKKISNYLQKRKRIVNKDIKIKLDYIDTPYLSNLKKLNNSPIVGNLKYIEKNNILDLIKKNTYRGFRHKKGLPVRGQRTRTNRQTRKRLARRRNYK